MKIEVQRNGEDGFTLWAHVVSTSQRTYPSKAALRKFAEDILLVLDGKKKEASVAADDDWHELTSI